MSTATTVSGRAARIWAGLGANGVTQASQLIMRLIEVPILLGLWGAAGYGQWLLIAALPTALSFSDGGFTKTARREMAMRAGRGDDAGIVAVFQSAWVLLLMLSAFVLVLLAAILPRLPLAPWLGLNALADGEVSLALLALAAQVLVYFQCGLLHGALASRGRYAAGELLIASSAILCFCGMVAGAALGGGIVGAALGSFGGQVAGYNLMLLVYLRQVGAPRYGLMHASVQQVRALWAPSIANLAFPVADALNTQGIRLVVGLSLGPVALAIFSTTRTLCRVALQPVMAIGRTVEPELSLAYGAGQEDDARRLFMRASNAGFWLSATTSLFVVVAGPFFYAHWAGRHLDLDWLALDLLAAASVLNTLWGTALTLACSVNRHAPLSIPFAVLYGAGSVLAALVFSKVAGISGVALGVLAGDATALLVVVSAALPLAGIGMREWAAATTRSPVSVVASAAGRAWRAWPQLRVIERKAAPPVATD